MVAGDVANLTKNITAGRIITNDVSLAIGALSIGDTGSGYFAYTVTNNSGVTFTFDNNGNGASLVQSTTTATDTIATSLILSDDLSVSNNSASATLVISGVISGTQGVLKAGAGTLTLSGANTFTGGFTASAGTVNLQGDQRAANGGFSVGVSNSAVTTVNLAAGATFAVAAGNQIRLGNTVATGTSISTFNIAGSVTNSGSLWVGRASVLNLNAGAAWTQNADLTLAAQGGYSAAMSVNSGASFAYNGTNAISIRPSLGNGGDSTLTVAGGTFTTSQGFANSISPAGSSGHAQIILTANGCLGLSASIPQLTSGMNTNSIPNISLGAGGGSIDTAGFTTAITNIIGGSGNLTKLGSGTLALGAINTYNGTTTISNGTLALLGPGMIAGSPVITVAATNAILQLAQSGSLTNNCLLVVNAGGVVALSNGVNQTVGALCLDGQWESDGTWGSSASSATNKNDVYFSGAGILTVSRGNSGHPAQPSFISSWYVRYVTGSYDSYNPAPGVIDNVPSSDVTSAAVAAWNYQYSLGLPTADMFQAMTDPNPSVTNVVAYFTTNVSPVMPLNYVIADYELSSGYFSNSQAACDWSTSNMVKVVRASTNANVNNAFVGNYACYPGVSDPALTPAARYAGGDTFYRNSGLSVAQPNAYPYSSYTGNGPNSRSGLFWSDLELVSFAKLNLPAGHRLLPWLDGRTTNSGSLVATLLVDNVALLAHVRLRGADGFCDLSGMATKTYGWSDLDWLFHGTGDAQIENLATSMASGVQWSGFQVGPNFAFLFSNLGNSAAAVSLPTLPGLPTATPLIPAGTHTAWYFVNDPTAIATNQIYLGRDGINHSLFVSGNFTLTNAILVADPGTNPPAAVTVGNCFTNDYSTTFAGPMILSNSVTLQSYAQNLTFAGAISGSGGITNIGNITFTGVDSHTGATVISAGTSWFNGSLASGSVVTVSSGGTLGGTGTVGGPVEIAGTVSPGCGGVGTLNTGDEIWDGGGVCFFKVSNATSISGGDFLNINGVLNLQAAPGSPFTIKLITLTTNDAPGPVIGFSSSNNYAWTIATASAGILNFDPAAFIVDTSTFSNEFVGTFAVTSNGNSLSVIYTPLIPPVINGHGTFSRGSFSLSFSGINGHDYRVLASTNLSLPMTNWLVLTNGTFGGGVLTFTDSAATNRQKLYRVASP